MDRRLLLLSGDRGPGYMGLRLLGMHMRIGLVLSCLLTLYMRIGTGMGTGYRLAKVHKGHSLVLSAKGTRKPRSVQWVFFRRAVPLAPGALVVTWVELTVR